jgi:hypothetical protein
MPLPEGYRPRKGDELLIRAKVEFDVDLEEKDVHLRVDYHKLVIPLAEVQALHIRSWKKGDRVLDEDGLLGTVIALHGSSVWVKRDAVGDEPADMWTFEANDLRPAPPKPEPDVSEITWPPFTQEDI